MSHLNWSGIGWTVYGNFGLNSSLDKYNLVALVGTASHLLESSIIIVVALAGLLWLLCMSLKFIAWGISGCAYLWWNLCPCCPVVPSLFTSSIFIWLASILALSRVIWAYNTRNYKCERCIIILTWNCQSDTCFIYSLTRVYSFKSTLFTMFYSFDLKNI